MQQNQPDQYESLDPMEEEESDQPGTEANSRLTFDPLEDLYTEAQLAAGKPIAKRRKVADPSDRHSLDAAAKKMRDIYLLPENWERTRGIVLLDTTSHTLIGNFSEYLHKFIPGTRKLVREHQPIPIDATEFCDGYLGPEMSFRAKQSWEVERRAVCHLLLSELMVEAPDVQVLVKARLGAIVRAELIADTQFASCSGQTLLILPAGTNVYEALGVDSKIALRKAAGL